MAGSAFSRLARLRVGFSAGAFQNPLRVRLLLVREGGRNRRAAKTTNELYKPRWCLRQSGRQPNYEYLGKCSATRVIRVTGGTDLFRGARIGYGREGRVLCYYQLP